MNTNQTYTKKSEELTIAIISYNSYEAIKQCLDDLIKSDLFPITIVDNASTDDSASRLSIRYPNAKVIKSNINLGYGRGANLAISSCSTKYLFLINPDLKATPEKTALLLETFKSLPENVALLAPAVTNKTHTKQGLQEKEWVIGAGMMFNLSRLESVGNFDENIFLFSEETDLCKRIRDNGYRIYLNSDLYIEHLYRQSSTPNPKIEALKDWHQAWSQLYFHRKHESDHGKRNPYRVAAIYAIKYLFATDKLKKQRYKFRFQGSMSFLNGRPSFNRAGEPYDPTIKSVRSKA